MKIKLKIFAFLNRTKGVQNILFEKSKMSKPKKPFRPVWKSIRKKKNAYNTQTNDRNSSLFSYFSYRNPSGRHYFSLRVEECLVFIFFFLFIFFSFRHYSNFECLQNVVFYCFNFETKRYQILSSVFSFHLI